ncbi:MAG: glycosyltransferase family 2 protein [Desulfomonile tiedjei]|nr:glycosyltransferase family 2 protein [Desulfomonile tiedjei]
MDDSAPKQQRPRLSLVIIAKNEADRIGDLLQSCPIADEVLVVDSGSTDGTVDVARSFGARVIHQEWLGYVAQKQMAMETASSEWILSMDADEALSQESVAEILRALENVEPEVQAFSMPRMSRYLNRWIKHGGWYPDRKVRLIRRGSGLWAGDALHDRLEVNGRVERLQHPILHYVYRDISDQVKTINNFSTVDVHYRGMRGPGYVVLGLLHAVGKFLECAVWKLGLLDGIPGLIIAVNSAFYVFLKHAKSWELSLPRDERK